MSGFTALLARDLRLVWRRPGDVMVVLAFFVVATVLFPLGIGPETNLLARIAAGILWCAALFAALLSLERLFAADYEDGALDLLLLAPLMGLLFGLSGEGLLAVGLTLLVGTPALSLIGGLAAALTLGARRGGALLALLALPLCVPTLIFGTSAVESVAMGEGFLTHLAILGALALLSLATLPWAIAAALRQAGE